MDSRLIQILEKQKQDLVVRVLKKHEEVAAIKKFNDRLLASLSDLFFLLTRDFQVVQANREFHKTLGYQSCENLHLQDLTDKENCERISLLLNDKGEIENFETGLQHRDGRLIPVILNGSTYTTDSGRVLHMLIGTNRSDFQKMMLQIQEAQEQLLHADRLAGLGEMAAGIGHELTQPLNAILLFARNCLKALDSSESNKEMLQENLNIIIERTKKASSIIRSLKNYAGKKGAEATLVDINAILHHLLGFLENQLNGANIQVAVNLSPELPWLFGHEVKLEQVFLNLIQNAMLAVADVKQPEISIKSAIEHTMDPQTLEERDFIVVSIGDNGVGMSEEVQRKIFNPFFTTREVGTGMGLGLSIVDRIINDMSGFIRVESVPGQGSCFFVLLPRLTEMMVSDSNAVLRKEK